MDHALFALVFNFLATRIVSRQNIYTSIDNVMSHREQESSEMNEGIEFGSETAEQRRERVSPGYACMTL